MGTDRRGWPVWVRVGLGRVPSRWLARASFWVVLVLATGSAVLCAVSDLAYLPGVLLLPAALWTG